MMADLAGLVKLFCHADQITLGVTLPDGQGAVVTLNDEEMELVAMALLEATEPGESK